MLIAKISPFTVEFNGSPLLNEKIETPAKNTQTNNPMISQNSAVLINLLTFILI